MQNIKPTVFAKREYDNILFIITSFLVLIGTIMVLSASQYSAAQAGNEFRLFLTQLLGAGLGFAAMLIIPHVKFEFIASLTWLFYLASMGLLVATIFLGREIGGATRWISIAGIQFQPSEFAKVAIILALPIYIMSNKGGGRDKVNTLRGIMGCGLIVGLPIALVLVAGGTSTAIIFAAIGFAIYFVASPFFWRLVALVGIGAGAGVSLLMFQYFAGEGFRGARFGAWLNPYLYAQGVGFQTIQSLYAIASGGLFGLGIGNSNQKLNFLPEAHNDFIFAIIVEETGIFGGMFILLLFGILIWRGAMIAIKCSRPVGTLMATGVLTMISVQLLINVGVVTNTIPNTGIPLPFISYGGTSIAVMMASIGLLLNISRHQKMEESMLIYSQPRDIANKKHARPSIGQRRVISRKIEDKIKRRRA